MTLQNRNEILQSSSVAGAVHKQAILGAVFRLDDRAVCAIQGLIVGIIVTYEPHTGMTAFAPPRFLKMVRPVDDRIFIIYPVSP